LRRHCALRHAAATYQHHARVTTPLSIAWLRCHVAWRAARYFSRRTLERRRCDNAHGRRWEDALANRVAEEDVAPSDGYGKGRTGMTADTSFCAGRAALPAADAWRLSGLVGVPCRDHARRPLLPSTTPLRFVLRCQFCPHVNLHSRSPIRSAYLTRGFLSIPLPRLFCPWRYLHYYRIRTRRTTLQHHKLLPPQPVH